MKPSTEVKQKESVVNVPQESTNDTRKCSKLVLTVMVAGTLVLAIVAGIVLAAVHFGMSAQREAYKGGWMTLVNTDDPQISVTEKLVVTDDEIDVTQPGAIRFIYNNEMGTIVILPDEPVRDGNIGACFVADIGIEVDTKALGNAITSNIKEEISFEENEHVFKSTGVRADISTLSPRAQEMCIGRDIMQVEEVEIKGRVARSTDKPPKEKTVTVSILWGVVRWKKTVKN